MTEVDNLIKNGGSIKEKYNLLWKQQMDRRKTLAQLGSASVSFVLCTERMPYPSFTLTTLMMRPGCFQSDGQSACGRSSSAFRFYKED